MLTYLSLFDGIGAACVAWEPLGWKCVGVSEIEQFAVAVTSHHRPHVPHLGDVTKITEEQVAALGRIDLIVGGFPCQDLSVAGKRAGLRNLDGSITRSGLFFAAMRIVRWAREHCGLRWLLIENVPGLYSSNRGRDFAAVVGEMVGAEFDVPNGGWRNAGFAVGPEGLCEWATLDAQFFNLAQRRVRVFALADFGDWSNRPPVLLEPESLRGDSSPSREAREDVAGTVTRRTCSSVEAGVAPTLQAGGNSTGGNRPPGTTVDTCDSLIPVGVDFQNVATTGAVCGTLMGEAQRKGGQAGHGVLAQPYTLAIRGRGDSSDLEYRQDGTANALLTPNGGHANGGGQVAVAFAHQAGGKQTTLGYDPETNTAPTLTNHQTPAVAFAQNQRDEVRTMDVAGALAAEPGAKQQTYAQIGMQVRRLTPTECARLQGFPDDYLDITYRGKPAADGNKYKALGNSMAVPVMAWLGRRINAVEAMTAHESTWVAIKDAPEKEEA